MTETIRTETPCKTAGCGGTVHSYMGILGSRASYCDGTCGYVGGDHYAVTEEPTTAEIMETGPYLIHDSTDVILFVPDMGDGEETAAEWREWLEHDGFMRLEDEIWFNDAGPQPDAELLKWRERFDSTFPGVRKIEVQAEAYLAAKVKRETALPIQRPYGKSRLFK